MKQDDVYAMLGRIPGWEDAEFRALQGGQNNRAWLVEKDGRRAVLKIDTALRGLPFASRDEEARLQALAADAGIAANVYYASDTVLLTEYLTGSSWRDEHLLDDGNLRRIAAVARRLHALPCSGRRYEPLGAARQYAACVPGELAGLARTCVDIVAEYRLCGDLRPCHNDLVAANVIDGESLRLIDWEYACDNDPAFDIATLIAHHNLGEPQADILIDAYGADSIAGFTSRVRACIRTYDALHWLWRAARDDVDEMALLAIAARLA